MDELKFAFVVDDELFHFMTFPNDPRLEGVIAGLRSKPTLIELPENIEISQMRPGLKYINGQIMNFGPPEDQSYDYEVED